MEYLFCFAAYLKLFFFFAYNNLTVCLVLNLFHAGDDGAVVCDVTLSPEPSWLEFPV